MTSTTKQAPAKSKAWIWLVVLGPILTIIGIIIGSSKSGMCGSVFRSDSLAAELFDSMGGYGYGSAAADCQERIAAAAVPTWILIVLGIALVLTGIVVRSIINNRPAPTVVQQAPSVATQIEDLSRLKEQGLLSDEEFKAKRAELISRL
ncbi:SHOCT domain-containing protein [Pseudarthrobacter sp. MDT3-1]